MMEVISNMGELEVKNSPMTMDEINESLKDLELRRAPLV
jgi:hypothetical protein